MAKKFQQRYEAVKSHDFMKKVLELDPADEKGYKEECTYEIAVWEGRGNKNPGAIKAFIEAYPDSERFLKDAYNNLAFIYRRDQDAENTAATYETMLQKFPNDARAHYSYASAIFDMKMADLYEKGLVLNKKAVELDPEMERAAFYNLITYLSNTEKTEQLLAEFDRALTEQTDNTRIANLYATTIVNMKIEERYDSAIQLLEKAIEDNPKSTYMFFTLHSLFKAKGDMDTAHDYLKKLIEANPNVPYYKKALEDFERELKEKKS